MLYRKFLREKTHLSDDLPEIGCPVVKVESLYFQFFFEPIWRIFSMLLNSHPTIKWRSKSFVAISLMLNHNLTGLNRGYYMVARRYEVSLRVLKNISRVSAANE